AGDPRAEAVLGSAFYRGRGVPQNDSEAAKWFRLAADQGNAVARFTLGVMYGEGRGVPQDYAEAARWARLAAGQGDARAQRNLGLAYAGGEGVTQNAVDAHMWFTLAAARFPASDTRNRTAAVKNRDTVANEMSSDQLAEAQKRARVEAAIVGSELAPRTGCVPLPNQTPACRGLVTFKTCRKRASPQPAVGRG